MTSSPVLCTGCHSDPYRRQGRKEVVKEAFFCFLFTLKKTIYYLLVTSYYYLLFYTTFEVMCLCVSVCVRVRSLTQYIELEKRRPLSFLPHTHIQTDSSPSNP